MVDLVLAALLIGYAVSGYRQGLIVGALSLGGFLCGALLAMTLIPDLVDGHIGGGTGRTVVVLGGVMIVAWAGQVAGAYAGAAARRSLGHTPFRIADQCLGAVAGLVSVALVLWFVAGAVRGSSLPSVSRAVASSRVISGIDRIMPQQLSSLAESLRSAVAGGDFPRVFAGLRKEDIEPVQTPDPAILSQAVLQHAARSIVKVIGEATSCDRGQEGSGVVISPQHVMTNAHVVAGMPEPTVQVGGVGRHYPAIVVVFDPRRDIAVLDVPGLTAPSLPASHNLARNDGAIVAGFPHNGAFTAGAGRVRELIRAKGDDIYGRGGAVRQVYSLYATVQPGNSGGPLLDSTGSLAGLVFAKSLDDAHTGYALTLDEVMPVLQTGRTATTQVSSGGCTPG